MQWTSANLETTRRQNCLDEVGSVFRQTDRQTETGRLLRQRHAPPAVDRLRLVTVFECVHILAPVGSGRPLFLLLLSSAHFVLQSATVLNWTANWQLHNSSVDHHCSESVGERSHSNLSHGDSRTTTVQDWEIIVFMLLQCAHMCTEHRRPCVTSERDDWEAQFANKPHSTTET